MPRGPDGSISISTFNDLIEEGYRLSFHCNEFGCGKGGEMDLKGFADWLGGGHGTLVGDLQPYFKCVACGSRKLGLILSPPAPAAPGSNVAVPPPRIGPAPEAPGYREQKRPRRKGKRNNVQP